MEPIAHDETARRHHRDGLSMMMRQAAEVDAQQRRADALLWLLQISDQPPTSTDPGHTHKHTLAAWADSLQKSTNLPTISGSRDRMLAVTDRARHIQWGLDRAAEVAA